MSKHTKGPWKCRVTWNPLGYPCYQIEPVIPASQSSGNYLEISGEHVANARVIAAAPELLEALEFFVIVCKTGDPMQLMHLFGEACDKAEFALAKAKGE